MYVFRDGKYEATGADLISRLQSALWSAHRAPENECEDALLAALIAAGELECALLDARADDSHMDASCSIAALITDGLARAFLTGHKDSFPSIHQLANRIEVGARYHSAVQEGFAYYALHPRKLAALLDQMLLDGILSRADGRVTATANNSGLTGGPVRVLGIRSIGVTLGAVACATLGLRGIDCRRISVRPDGHPYDRQLSSSPRLRQWVRSPARAEFLVVDEGPGISGSSFLAVAEALEDCGIQNSRIHMIGSRQVDPAQLLARDASRRWARFRFHAIPDKPLVPPEAGENFSSQIKWKFFGCAPEGELGTWSALEPAMYLSQNKQSTFTFTGFGQHGEAVNARCKTLADAGFAPSYLGNARGFTQSALPAGRLLSPADLSPQLISRIADYLAFRAQAFAVPHEQARSGRAGDHGFAAPQTPELEIMLRRNWQIEFGEELGLAESQLKAERVVICDGRMGPRAWLRSTQGELLKLDSGNEGNNHFFPGPCDIAWDLAGCIVEWELPPDARCQLIEEYNARSSDAIAARLTSYLLAYATFCMARAKMAASASTDEAEKDALVRDYHRYRALVLCLHSPQSLPQCAGDEATAGPLERAS